MNSGCSASTATGVCWSLAVSTTSDHQTSTSSFQATSWPVRFTTSTCCTDGVPLVSASSTAGFSALAAPRRYPPSAVTTSLASASLIRVLSASAENPPNTTECGAPMRAHASMVTTASGISGR